MTIRFDHRSLQPLLDQPQDAGVFDPLWEHSPHPGMLDMVKESTNVSLIDPWDRLGHDGLLQSVQGIMRTASRAKAIGPLQEIGFVNGCQEPVHRRRLQQAVFHFGDAQRPLFGRLSGFRNI